MAGDTERLDGRIDETNRNLNDLVSKIYNKIDETNRNITAQTVEVVKLKAAVENQKAPVRPCPDHTLLVQSHNQLKADFNEHISKHETINMEVKKDKKDAFMMWRNSGINLFFELLKLAIVGGIGGAIGFFAGK